jgi:hypothetical protein
MEANLSGNYPREALLVPDLPCHRGVYVDDARRPPARPDGRLLARLELSFGRSNLFAGQPALRSQQTTDVRR